MSLLTVLTAADTLEARLDGALPPHHDLTRAVSWGGLRRLVRERPVSGVVIDSDRLVTPTDRELNTATGQLRSIRRDYPSVGLVVLARADTQGELLFHLGAAGLSDLRLIRTEELSFRLDMELTQALRWSAASRVTQALASRFPRRHLPILRRTFETLHRQLGADEFARLVGAHRPQLSRALVASGLPSVGRLMLWGRLLQGALWLAEPGRTAESVSRQLEYSDGAAFRRALRRRLNATPSDVVAAGGLTYALECFLEACSVGVSPAVARAV